MSVKRAVGIDLGGTNLRAALVELQPPDRARIVEQLRQPVGGDREPRAVAALLADSVRALSGDEPLPAGAGIAAMLRGTTGVVANAPNLGWRDVPFAALAREALGRPVSIENDLSAITWGEARFGAARGMRDILCVFVGTGIGGGIVTGGQLYRGASNAGGEIGHTKVREGGIPCGCGALGCLETYAGGRYIARRGRELASEALLALAGGDRAAIHAGTVDQAAEQGDLAAQQIIDEGAQLLGRQLANAVTVLNPECLLLGGTTWTGCSRLGRHTLERFEQQVNAPAREQLQIAQATLVDEAGVLGAADLALHHP